MTFIKVRRQLTRSETQRREREEEEEARGLQTKPPPQPRNLIQYKSPGIKLFRLMARQTNVVETRLRLYNQDQVPRSATPLPSTLSSPYTVRSSRATPTAITISVATDTTTTFPGQILRQFDRKEGRESTRAEGREHGEVEPTLPRPTANFIPNLKNGRANELLNYSVALRRRGVYIGTKLASKKLMEIKTSNVEQRRDHRNDKNKSNTSCENIFQIL